MHHQSKPWRRAGFLALIGLGFLALAKWQGCFPSPASPSCFRCKSSSTCGSGYRCIEGYCARDHGERATCTPRQSEQDKNTQEQSTKPEQQPEKVVPQDGSTNPPEGDSPPDENQPRRAIINCPDDNVLRASRGDWVRLWGSNISVTIQGIRNASDGSIYAVGHFQGSIQFCGKDIKSIGRNDLFLAQFKASGELLWLELIQTPTDKLLEQPKLVVGPSGNLYLTAYHNDKVTLTQPTTPQEVTVPGSKRRRISNDGPGLLVLKLSRDGLYQWHTSFATGADPNDASLAGVAFPHQIMLTTKGQVLILGAFEATTLTSTPGSLPSLKGSRGFHCFVLSLNASNGEPKWLKGLPVSPKANNAGSSCIARQAVQFSETEALVAVEVVGREYDVDTDDTRTETIKHESATLLLNLSLTNGSLSTRSVLGIQSTSRPLKDTFKLIWPIGLSAGKPTQGKTPLVLVGGIGANVEVLVRTNQGTQTVTTKAGEQRGFVAYFFPKDKFIEKFSTFSLYKADDGRTSIKTTNQGIQLFGDYYKSAGVTTATFRDPCDLSPPNPHSGVSASLTYLVSLGQKGTDCDLRLSNWEPTQMKLEAFVEHQTGAVLGGSIGRSPRNNRLGDIQFPSSLQTQESLGFLWYRANLP